MFPPPFSVGCVWVGWCILLEVVGVLAEGQAQGFQGMTVVFLGTEQQGQQVEAV